MTDDEDAIAEKLIHACEALEEIAEMRITDWEAYDVAVYMRDAARDALMKIRGDE